MRNCFVEKKIFSTLLLATVALVAYVTHAEAAQSVDSVNGDLHALEWDNHGRKRRQKFFRHARTNGGLVRQMDSAKEKKRQEITAYLDRIEKLEDGTAKAVFLVEIDEDEFSEFVLPANFLPADADEGEYLTITISRDENKTQTATDEAQELLNNLEE